MKETGTIFLPNKKREEQKFYDEFFGRIKVGKPIDVHYGHMWPQSAGEVVFQIVGTNEKVYVDKQFFRYGIERNSFYDLVITGRRESGSRSDSYGTIFSWNIEAIPSNIISTGATGWDKTVQAFVKKTSINAVVDNVFEDHFILRVDGFQMMYLFENANKYMLKTRYRLKLLRYLPKGKKTLTQNIVVDI
jgi:hypothetical protein